jgi:hypothetical protein
MSGSLHFRAADAHRPHRRTPFGVRSAQRSCIGSALGGEKQMTFQRIIVGLLILTIAGLAGAFYIDWKLAVQLRTVKAFVEGYVFAEAVAACEKVQSSTPFKWNSGTHTAVIGLNSVKPDKNTVVSSYTLVADGVYCDYDPIKKKADIGSNFLERE